MKKKRVKQLERFKTEINLVEYATNVGYRYSANESSPVSAVLRHDSGDLILVVTDTDGHGVYFSPKDDRNKGTIIDFIQHRRNLSLGEVRKELRPWLNRGVRDEVVGKPEPTDKDTIDECFTKLKKLNQPSPQPPEPKPRRKKRSQLQP